MKALSSRQGRYDMSVILTILAVIAAYIVVSYIAGAMSYKRNGCGLDTLAFLASPLILPLVVMEWLRNLRHRMFR